MFSPKILPRLARRLSGVCAVAAFAALLSAPGCDEQNTVVVHVTPIAHFHGYVLTGHADPPSGFDPDHEYVYYRVDWIDNQGSDAVQFTLTPSQFSVKDDDDKVVSPMSSAQQWDGRFPSVWANHSATVEPGTRATFPMGDDAPRIIVFQNRSTGYQRLQYNSVGGPQPVLLSLAQGVIPEFKETMDSHHLEVDLK